MMLVVAPAEDKRETNMATDHEDDNLQATSVVNDGDNDTDTGASNKQRATKPSDVIKKSSTSKVKGGTPSRSRSTAENGDRKTKTLTRPDSTPSTIPPEDEGSVRSGRSAKKKISKDSKTAKPGLPSCRRVRPTGDIKADTREAAGTRIMRLRPSCGSQTIPLSTSRKDEDNQSSADPKNMDSSASTRKRRSKSKSSRADGGMDRSGRSARSEKSSRSVRSEQSVKSSTARKAAKPESTLDSTNAAVTTPDDSPPPSPGTEPVLSLRSSVKVASALVKFRKVLAMSKEATATAQKYSDEQKRQAEADAPAGEPIPKESNKSHPKGDTSRHSKHVKSQHKKVEDRGENSSRHGRASKHRKNEDDGGENTTRSVRSGHHRKGEDGCENSSVRSKKRSKGQSSTVSEGASRTTKQSSASSKKQEPAVGEADAILKHALSNVGKKLQQSSSTLKADSDPPAVSSNKGPASARVKSSAKVSTAMLKFQQALALSKSATQAAKTQQDTQNKLLGEVHGEKRTPEHYLARTPQPSKTAIAVSPPSPVSPVDVGPLKGADSPKVPDDLDGDSDIDSEIEIEDVDEDDDTVSDVATDSEEEESVGVDGMNDEKPRRSGNFAPVSVVSCNTDSDFDMASDVEDHSDVEIDSDDDLDSDDDADGDGDMSSSHDSESEKDEKKSSRGGRGSDTEGNDSKADSDDNGSSVNGKQKGQAGGSKVAAKGNLPLGKLPLSPAVDVASRQVIARSFSFNSSLQSSQSLLDKKDLTSLSKDDHHLGTRSPNQERDEDGTSYLPRSIVKPKTDTLEKEKHEHGKERRLSSSSSSRKLGSRPEVKRRPSSRSLKKSKSSVDSSVPAVPLDTARKLLGDESLGRRAGGSSRIRKPAVRSKSNSSQGAPEEGTSQRERRSKTTSSGSSDGDRKKGSERSKRSSLASRGRTLTGISNLTQKTDPPNAKADPPRSVTPKADPEEEGRRPSARRRTPNRAKSYDPSALPVRKSLRGSSKNRRVPLEP